MQAGDQNCPAASFNMKDLPFDTFLQLLVCAHAAADFVPLCYCTCLLPHCQAVCLPAWRTLAAFALQPVMVFLVLLAHASAGFVLLCVCALPAVCHCRRCVHQPGAPGLEPAGWPDEEAGQLVAAGPGALRLPGRGAAAAQGDGRGARACRTRAQGEWGARWGVGDWADSVCDIGCCFKAA